MMSPGAYTNAEAVTKHDTNTIRPTVGLYVGGTGDVKVKMAGEGRSIVTFSAVPVGAFLPIAVVQVFSTGTTATLILALR